VVISPVYDDNGSHVGFAKVTRDQTKQREHEEERQHSVSQQTHLLAVTAHELRTPTAVIEGSAGELQASWDVASTELRTELLTNIHSSAHRLRRLASDLAIASQLHGGTLQYQFEEVSLAALLNASVARKQSAHHDVPIEADVPSDVTITADAERLAQAVDNLLDNAIRHSRAPIRLSVDGDDEMVSIRVSDGGTGIPAQLVPRLFERFAIAGPRGGTGLGLYLVRQIAQAHGGDVEYHAPHAGRPSEFEVQLPRTAG
jgi:signal transduction histidine kinase